MIDLTLRCEDCGKEFVWSAEEQSFYQSKGLKQPQYCQICRGKYKAGSQDQFRGRTKQAADF
ncbi:hypothetical protein A2W24_02520 [Microgenomates group bacterium RBG_16_45_19]|nr:MAG: hypothetical protein A2W24_02520 [Microgenomates group bacterium RBG_16_45_19]